MTVLLHDADVMLSDGKFAALEQYIPLKFEVQNLVSSKSNTRYWNKL